MPVPYYVSPEQLMKDKADYARQGIARGRSVIAFEYEAGILFMAENPSATLHKISESSTSSSNCVWEGSGSWISRAIRTRAKT
jgi:proteasome alpha subunit